MYDAYNALSIPFATGETLSCVQIEVTRVEQLRSESDERFEDAIRRNNDQ